MAVTNKKIQLRDSAGNNLFPNVKKATMDDFEHSHTFTGTKGTITVKGNNNLITDVTINDFTPSGSITLSRSANVTLSTVSINNVTNVGTLPTRASFTYNNLTVSGTTLNIASATAYQITGVGSLPTTSTVNVANDVKTQPAFSGTFSGTKVSLEVTPTQSPVELTLSGSYTPTGTVGNVK